MSRWRFGSLAGVLLSASLASAQQPANPMAPVLPGMVPPAATSPAPVMPGAPGAVPCDPCAAPGCGIGPGGTLNGLWGGPTGTDSRIWGSAEYLLWHLSGYNVPPLVTTGPAQFPVGFLGNPGTQVLFGGSSLNPAWYSGMRFTLGAWLDDCRTCGAEAYYFFLGRQNLGTNFNSAATPVLARPFTNANTGGQFSEFAAFPGASTGGIGISAPTNFWGAGALLRKPLCCGCSYSVDMLGGFQFLNLDESLTVTEASTFPASSPFPALAGKSFLVTDRFATENRFYGGQVGLDSWVRRGRLLAGIFATVGLGSTHQVVDIQGSQRVTNLAGQVTNFQGGLLALPGANIGRVEHDAFSVVPQVGLNLGYQVTDRITIFGGYSFLFWTNVVRPGDQIDPVLDINRIPNFVTNPNPVNPPRPANPFKQTDLWVHGLNVGVALNW